MPPDESQDQTQPRGTRAESVSSTTIDADSVDSDQFISGGSFDGSTVATDITANAANRISQPDVETSPPTPAESAPAAETLARSVSTTDISTQSFSADQTVTGGSFRRSTVAANVSQPTSPSPSGDPAESGAADDPSGGGGQDQDSSEAPLGSGVLFDETSPPTDPDGDGLFEDVDGDGDVGQSDVELLLRNASQVDDERLDFNDDGQVTAADADALFDSLNQSSGQAGSNSQTPFPDGFQFGSGFGTPTDPDGDGFFEDVDGDGDVDGRDVFTLNDASTDRLAEVGVLGEFDLDGDGRIGIDDQQRVREDT